MSARPWLRIFTPLYGALVAARNAAYARHWLRARSLPAPVISVGNLSTGGSGKTPFVLELAALLRERGWSPVVLSRGYKSNASRARRVDPEGNAAEFGDEPLLLARAGVAPVFVAAERYRAGVLAAREFSATGRGVFLLDDGFQHRRLQRDVDIVLLRAADFEDALLPAGNLREPLNALARADVLVAREEELSKVAAGLSGIALRHPQTLWVARRRLELAAVPDGPAVAFAGIAHPEEFFSALRAAGAPLAGALAYADHHNYTFRDVTQILAALQAAGARVLLTTEKDATRLSGQARAALEKAADLRAVPLRVELLEPEKCLAQLPLMRSGKA